MSQSSVHLSKVSIKVVPKVLPHPSELRTIRFENSDDANDEATYEYLIAHVAEEILNADERGETTATIRIPFSRCSPPAGMNFYRLDKQEVQPFPKDLPSYTTTLFYPVANKVIFDRLKAELARSGYTWRAFRCYDTAIISFLPLENRIFNHRFVGAYEILIDWTHHRQQQIHSTPKPAKVPTSSDQGIQEH